MEGFIDFENLKREAWDRSTPAERQEYLDAADEAELQIQLAELVYKMRTEAGITQTELARRMGARQPFISAIERGAKFPTVETLARIARATGNHLRLVSEPA
jgi:ribosome-binding protein aMBF1 (putative translation factor)